MTRPDANRSDAELGLADAYSVKTPQDSRTLYDEWAGSYDTGFVEYMGYVYHRTVADLFAAHRGSRSGPVLDVGCGTGVVGAELRRVHVEPVDGIDISPAMLDQASAKRTSAGDSVYRELIVGDLTGPLAIDSDRYNGIVSAGTFTHGHVGPDALEELVRIAADDALFTIGINAEHYAGRGFAAMLDDLTEQRSITPPEVVDVAIYEATEGGHANDRALVAIFSTCGAA